MYKESSVRSILKTVSWRLWATAITVILVWLFTKQAELALSIGGLEMSSKLIAYFLHERIWNNINMGRQETNN